MKHPFSLFLLMALLIYSCSYKDREYDLEFLDNYQSWMPDENTVEMVYTDSTGNSKVYTPNRFSDGSELVYVDGDEGVSYYYYGKWKSQSYSADSGPIIEYKYYTDYQYDRQVDVAELRYGTFMMRIAIPDDYNDKNNYSDYSNYLFADTLLINGQLFQSVYYRESLNGDDAIYYQPDKIIGFKTSDATYLLNE